MSADICAGPDGTLHSVEAFPNPDADGQTPKPWKIRIDADTIPTPDWLIMPRIARSESLSVVWGQGQGGNDQPSYLVTSDGQVLTLTPSNGTTPGAIEYIGGGLFRCVYVMGPEATHYRRIIVSVAPLHIESDAPLPLPPEQVRTSQGILDYVDDVITWTGDPRYPASSPDNWVQVNGASLRRVMRRGGYTIGGHQYSDQATCGNSAGQNWTVWRGKTPLPVRLAVNRSGQPTAAISGEFHRSYFVPFSQWEPFSIQLDRPLARPARAGYIYRLTDRADWGGDDPHAPATFDILFEPGTFSRATLPFYGGLASLQQAGALGHEKLIGIFCAPHPKDIDQLERDITDAHELGFRALAYHDEYPLERIPRTLRKGDILAVQCYSRPDEDLGRFMADRIDYLKAISVWLPAGVELGLMWQSYDMNGTQTDRKRLEALQYGSADAFNAVDRVTHIVWFNDRSKGGARAYVGEMRPVHQAIVASIPGVPVPPDPEPEPPKPEPEPPKPSTGVPRFRTV